MSICTKACSGMYAAALDAHSSAAQQEQLGCSAMARFPAREASYVLGIKLVPSPSLWGYWGATAGAIPLPYAQH